MSDDDEKRQKYGLWVVLLGLVALIIVFVIASWRWRDVKDATAALGAVTGTIGALVGAYFGFHAGASGKEKAEEERKRAEVKVEQLAGLLPREDAIRILGMD